MNTTMLAAEREIVIAASANDVFSALTNPRQIVRWWGDDSIYHTTAWDHDPRTGGSYRHVGRFVDGVQNGRAFEGTGAYRVIEPPRILEYTRRYTGGVPIPEETVIRYELDDLDGRTRLRVVHSGFKNVEGRDEHGEHWVHVLGWLNSFIGKPDYEKRIQLNASPDAVFDALTTTRSLSSWWGPATGDGSEGGQLHFDFGEGKPLVVRVRAARRASMVIWYVEECDFLPDWVGTSPSFSLNSADRGCELDFQHDGLTPKLECYSLCSKGWDTYLPSLKGYVETGRGTPVVALSD